VWVLCVSEGARPSAIVSARDVGDSFGARSGTVAHTQDTLTTHGIQEVEGSTPLGSIRST